MRTVAWDPDGPTVRLIDQRLLPAQLDSVALRTSGEVAAAIRDMAVRGAPAIGAAAAFGLAVAGLTSDAPQAAMMLADLDIAAKDLRGARPTAVNLDWALDRMLAAARQAAPSGTQGIQNALIQESQRIADEDVEINRRIGLHGAELILDGDTVIHHCNTGALATVDYGTALGVIRTAHEGGKRVHVLVDETRPRLQGARLTAWELEQYGIPYDIITDSAAGRYLQTGAVAAVFVGADRVAANGDVANKIGTYMLALAAHDNQVPFYCALPTSTIDHALPSGIGIPIEDRDPLEVLGIQRQGKPIAPETASARNPAFDITPNRLITAFITEVGIIHPPFSNRLLRAVEEAKRP